MKAHPVFLSNLFLFFIPHGSWRELNGGWCWQPSKSRESRKAALSQHFLWESSVTPHFFPSVVKEACF